MPVYCYSADTPSKSCANCHDGFEEIQRIVEPALTECPKCGAPVHRVPASVNVGRSESNLDDRAKAAGFSKLKRLGHGEYEKMY